MTIQKLSDGNYRVKDITHRQHLKKKGYSDKEIKEIEKKDIAAGKAKPGDMDKPMKQPWKDAKLGDASKLSPQQKARLKKSYRDIVAVGQEAYDSGDKESAGALDKVSNMLSRVIN